MRYQFVVPGEPGSKGRPRFSNRGKYVSVHTPPKTVEYENLVRLSFMEHSVALQACWKGPWK